METITKSRIPKTSFFEPRKNLPGKASDPENDESRFTSRFAGSYLRQFKSLHHKTTKTSIACAMEIPINGFGIADLVTVAWENNDAKASETKYSSDDFIARARPTVRAFEFKLSNWRKALKQATRYNFFSNVATVVLPIEKCFPPLNYLETFKKLRIGLWGFDIATNRIVTYYTPKLSRPFISQYQITAVQLVHSAAKSLPIL